MAYTTIDDSSLYFRVKTFNGSSSDGNAITWDETHSNMQPDWLWLKNRTAAQEHWLADSVRGTGKFLESNSTNAESSDGASGLASFDTNGFTVNDSARTNRNTMVGWGWKAGTSFSNDASATSVGTIDSSGSASSDAGFSIVSYTGTGSAGTIKHGLSTAPAVVLVKSRGGTFGWGMYHHKNTSAPETDYLSINNTDATVDDSVFWNDTAPTSSVFSLGGTDAINKASTTHIAYCFADVKGYSKFNSYSGSGSASGNFIHLGFKPSLIILKGNNTENWSMYDNKRLGYNVDNNVLYPNTIGTEGTSDDIDFLSNGFKIRRQTGLLNDSGVEYIYMAFAESPFVNSKGVPNNAE
tara:strand:+ start:664 stop:1722 length:1059 start_codon:yes stop_codon:yes gene_type:complete